MKKRKLFHDILENATRFYFSGHSLKETAEMIFEKYGMRIGKETLRKRLAEIGISRSVKEAAELFNKKKIPYKVVEEAEQLYMNGYSLEEVTQIICKKFKMKFCHETLRKRLTKEAIRKRKSMVKVSGTLDITIPIRIIRELHINTGDYLKIIIEKDSKEIHLYLRVPNKPKSRKEIQIKKSLPWEIIERLNLHKGDMITLKKVVRIKRSKVSTTINDDVLDLATLVQDYVMYDRFSKDGEEYLRLWYVKRGRSAKQIEVKRFIPLNRELGEFFGLLQAEGGKRNKLSFTNAIIAEHKKIVEIAEHYFGISRKKWKVCVYYNPNLHSRVKAEIASKTFLRNLGLKKAKISFIDGNRKLKKINFQIYISSKILSDVINTALKFLRKAAIKYKLLEFSKGFIIKALLGDGSCTPCRHNLEITLSEQDRKAQEDLMNIFATFGIDTNRRRNVIYPSTDFHSCLWLLKNKAFRGHNENRKKLLNYVINNYYFNVLYERLIKIKNVTTIKEFATKSGLCYNSAQMYLMRNSKRGFTRKVKEGTYTITKRGREFIKLYESAERELRMLNP